MTSSFITTPDFSFCGYSTLFCGKKKLVHTGDFVIETFGIETHTPAWGEACVVLKDHKYQSKSYCTVQTQGRLFSRGLSERFIWALIRCCCWTACVGLCEHLFQFTLINMLIKTIMCEHQNNKIRSPLSSPEGWFRGNSGNNSWKTTTACVEKLAHKKKKKISLSDHKPLCSYVEFNE